jgi:hypothetical protein
LILVDLEACGQETKAAARRTTYHTAAWQKDQEGNGQGQLEGVTACSHQIKRPQNES